MSSNSQTTNTQQNENTKNNSRPTGISNYDNKRQKLEKEREEVEENIQLVISNNSLADELLSDNIDDNANKEDLIENIENQIQIITEKFNEIIKIEKKNIDSNDKEIIEYLEILKKDHLKVLKMEMDSAKPNSFKNKKLFQNKIDKKLNKNQYIWEDIKLLQSFIDQIRENIKFLFNKKEFILSAWREKLRDIRCNVHLTPSEWPNFYAGSMKRYDIDTSLLDDYFNSNYAVSLIKAEIKEDKRKVMIKFNSDRKRSLKEIFALTRLNYTGNPHIPPILDTFRYDSAIAIVTPLYNAPLSSLQFLHCYGINIIRSWSLHLFIGIEHIHKAGVVHLGIKPSNLLLSFEGDIVITNYDVSAFSGDYNKNGLPIGSQGWMAPELKSQNSLFQSESDLYSAGLVILCWVCPIIQNYKELTKCDKTQKIISNIFEIFNPKSGFIGKITEENYKLYSYISQFRDQLNSPPTSPSLSMLSKAIDLTLKLINASPSLRINFPSILEHPFLHDDNGDTSIKTVSDINND